MWQIADCNLHSKQSYAHLNIGTELKTLCTGQYLDCKLCLTINNTLCVERKSPIVWSSIVDEHFNFQKRFGASQLVWLVGSGSSGFSDPDAPSDTGRDFHWMRVGNLFRTLNLQAFRSHWECGVVCGHVISPRKPSLLHWRVPTPRWRRITVL